MLTLYGATILEWIVFIWACCTIPLYFTVLVIIVKHRKVEPFNQPFFKICISVGVVDLLLVIFGYPTVHLRKWGWVDWSSFYRHSTFGWYFRVLPYAASWFISSAQINGVALLSLNRFMNIVYPHMQWSDLNVNLAILAKYLFSIMVACPFFTQEYAIKEVNVTHGENYVATFPPSKFRSAHILIVGFGYYSFVVVSVGTMYVLMWNNIRNHNKESKQMRSQQNDVMKKAELRLALMGFVLFLLTFLYCFLLVLLVALIKCCTITAQVISGILLFQTAVILSQVNPYILLACSMATRDKFAQLIRWKHNSVTPFVEVI